jgi:hypothetical protein
MAETPIMLGRVLRAGTSSFVLGCNQYIAEQEGFIPEFGGFVRADSMRGSPIYGLIYDVSVEDDDFVRQLVAAGIQDQTIIEDHRRNRQVLVSVGVLILGYGRESGVVYLLPPQPPGTLKEIYACTSEEVARVTAGHRWLRTVLTADDVPAEQLLAAALRRAAASRSPDQRASYLVDAGRELARLCLPDDLPVADAILRQLR